MVVTFSYANWPVFIIGLDSIGENDCFADAIHNQTEGNKRLAGSFRIGMEMG
jgi:hypothetical protein